VNVGFREGDQVVSRFDGLVVDGGVIVSKAVSRANSAWAGRLVRISLIFTDNQLLK